MTTSLRHHGAAGRRNALLLLWMVVLLLFVGKVSASDEGVMQDYIDDETGEVKSFDPNTEIEVKFLNKSKFRADIYYDDGQYGVFIATAEMGATTNINSFTGHKFFITRHGVRENLYPEEVEGEEDKPLEIVVSKPNQTLLIPEGAAPLSGERKQRNRCVDRYAMCERSGK